MKKHPDLKTYLERSGLTQAAFAARVGTTQSAISRILRGHRVPSLAVALRIAAAANIPLQSLVVASREKVA